MELRTQLAHVAFAIALVAAALAWLEPEPACSYAGASKVQRVLLMDAVQKHPTWIDAQHESVLTAAGLLDPDPDSYVM
jgi:hypothetical protein